MKRALLLLLIVAVASAIGLVYRDRRARAREAEARLEARADKVAAATWARVGTKHFVLYSDAPEPALLTVARELESLHATLENLTRRHRAGGAPLTVVLPAAGSPWRKLARPTPASPGSPPSRDPATLLVGAAHWEVDAAARGQLFRALAPVELRRLEYPSSSWLEHGVGALFARSDFDPAKGITRLRMPEPEVDTLLARGWLPWTEIFTAQAGELLRAREPARFEAQCAALAFFFLGDLPDVWRQAKFPRWLAELEAGQPTTPERFEQMFGAGEPEWNGELVAHLAAHVRTLVVPGFQLAASPVTDRRPATRAEIRELFLLDEILRRHDGETDAALLRLRDGPGRVEAFRPLVAEALRRRGRPGSALAELRAVIAQGAADGATYVLAARLQFERSTHGLTLDSRLGPEAVDIALWCERAMANDSRSEAAAPWLALTKAFGRSFDDEAFARIRELHAMGGEGVQDERVRLAMAVAWLRQGEARQHDARPWAQAIMDSLHADPLSRRLAADILRVVPEREP